MGHPTPCTSAKQTYVAAIMRKQCCSVAKASPITLHLERSFVSSIVFKFFVGATGVRGDGSVFGALRLNNL